MGELSNLPNIGTVIEQQLNQAGIVSEAQLRELGARAAWLRIRETDPSACMHRLLALEGALRNVRKTMLPDEVKAELKEFYQRYKK